MKLIVSGGRDYSPGWDEWAILCKIFDENNIIELVSGSCKTGVDTFAEYWAETYAKIPIRRFPADWDMKKYPNDPVLIRKRLDGTEYNAIAGPNRNEKMSLYSDAVVLFKGNKGTGSMRRLAKKYKLKVFYDENNP